MTDPKRGEIWLVSLGAARPGELGKTRPALVLSVDSVNWGGPAELLVVIPISSSREPSPLRPRVSSGEGVDRPSVAVCRGIRSVARSRFLHKLGDASPQTLEAVEHSMALLLGIDR